MEVEVALAAERHGLAERRKWAWAFVLGAFALHGFFFFKHPPGDLIHYVIPWYDQLKLTGLSEPVGNYSPPYLYLLAGLTVLDGLLPTIMLIKLLSLAGAAWLAFGAGELLNALRRPRILGVTIVLLPSVVFNTSLLGQADTFWVAPCILAVASAVRGRLTWVAIWSGVAFAFKLQAAFIAPFVVHLFFIRRAPLQIWMLAPATYVAALVPAWLSGWPAWDLANIYLNQILWQPAPEKGLFISDGASWWTLFGWLAPERALRSFWLGYLVAAAGTYAYWRYASVESARKLLISATVSAAGLPFLLPGMHERFYMLADVLAFLYALVFPSRRSIGAAILMQVASAFPVFVWTFQLEPLEQIAVPLAIAAITLFFWELVSPAQPSKIRMRRTYASSIDC